MAGRPLVVMSEMKVSQEDVRTRGCAWRGVAAGKASRFRTNRALSWGAKTNCSLLGIPNPGSQTENAPALLPCWLPRNALTT